MYNLQFKKSVINIHEYYQNNNYNNDEFIKMIDKCFGIKKTTFYNWFKDDDIINCDNIYENNNKLVNVAVETFIINLVNENKTIGIKNIKKKIKLNFKITINNKTISYILHKNNIKHKNIKSVDIYKENKNYKKKNLQFNVISNEQNNFILDNKDKTIKNIIKLFFELI
jgi:transposase